MENYILWSTFQKASFPAEYAKYGWWMANKYFPVQTIFECREENVKNKRNYRMSKRYTIISLEQQSGNLKY